MRAKQSAGLGAYSSYDSSLDSSASDIKHRERLIKTKERFERLDQKDDQERDFWSMCSRHPCFITSLIFFFF